MARIIIYISILIVIVIFLLIGIDQMIGPRRIMLKNLQDDPILSLTPPEGMFFKDLNGNGTGWPEPSKPWFDKYFVSRQTPEEVSKFYYDALFLSDWKDTGKKISDDRPLCKLTISSPEGYCGSGFKKANKSLLLLVTPTKLQSVVGFNTPVPSDYATVIDIKLRYYDDFPWNILPSWLYYLPPLK